MDVFRCGTSPTGSAENGQTVFIFVVDIILILSLRAQCSFPVIIDYFRGQRRINHRTDGTRAMGGATDHGDHGRTDFLRQREFVEGPIAPTGHVEQD